MKRVIKAYEDVSQEEADFATTGELADDLMSELDSVLEDADIDPVASFEMTGPYTFTVSVGPSYYIGTLSDDVQDNLVAAIEEYGVCGGFTYDGEFYTTDVLVDPEFYGFGTVL